MTSTASGAGNRYGTWALILGIVGLLGLFAPAAAVVVFLGAAVSISAVVLGVNGVLAHAARRATNRPQAVVGTVLGLLGMLLWLTAVIGLVVGV